MFVATRILDSEGKTGTADNDINAINHNGTIPGGYSVNHFLTDADSWYILTDVPNGMKHFDRVLRWVPGGDKSTISVKGKGIGAIRDINLITQGYVQHELVAYSDDDY